MNELDSYNSGEQIDSLLNQMEDMEQELTDKNTELETLRNQLQEKNQEIQNLSSGNQKLKSQIQSVNSVLSEQGELLRKQTEKLEKYSGSDIIFQENERLKIRIAETEKREKEMRDRAEVIFSEAKKKEGDADRKLAKANRMMAEYEQTLAGEVAQLKRQMQRELKEKSDRNFRRKSRQLSGITVVLLAAYLIQLAAFLFLEKNIVTTIPLWFRDRYRNLQWVSQCIGNFYQSLYLKMTTEISTQVTIGIMILVSVSIAVICFFLIRIGLRHLLQKWKKRWELYESRDMVLLKKCAMAGIAFMGFSISMVVVNLPFIPFRLNLVSWWILITGLTEFLYFYFDRHDFEGL